MGRVRGRRPRRARLPTQARIARNTSELDPIRNPPGRRDLPHRPQHRLRDAHGPHRPVEVPALVPFALRRRLDAWQPAERPENPQAHDDRKVRRVVNLAQPPRAGHDRVRETGGVQHRERDHLAPRQRVADPAIQRVRPIFREADDVGPRLDAGQLAPQTRDPRAHEDDEQPQRHPRSNPRSNSAKVSGPGAMKKTKIQIGQCASR